MSSTQAIGTVPRRHVGAAGIAWILVGSVSGLGLTYGLAAMHRESIVTGTTTLTPAAAVGVAALCYLAAAATRTRWVAWLGVPVFGGLAFAGLVAVLPWWTLFVLAAVVLLGVGAVLRTGQVTAVQAAALLGYFGIAIVALQLSPRLGLALAALTLAAHALWDIKHYRSEAVVMRSLAIFCVGLDLTVGAICLALAVAG
ncbi:hypothetical protein EXU48_04630 [Occultella glacieicola]|uniref:Uncharacterized protein n=1 Tax=Occultella glacieicola TaxID=2518684 RepID=A0ABY2ECC0_9MICO|nr:hypothetical protein [Occultella glacieicola]TDE97479.1 hypothetical protein EXU48_04630 [Occultella glacieicola]